MFYVILLIVLIFLLALAGAFLKARNASRAIEKEAAKEEFIGGNLELPSAGEKVYIGRQPPEDYVEPSALDGFDNIELESPGFMEKFNEIWGNYYVIEGRI